MSQIPFGPEDLKAPPLSAEAFLEQLRSEKERKYPDPPDFYRRLVAGDLSRDQLQLWVKDMYSYWDNLYHSTSAIYVKTNVENIRQNILRKLVEIEGEEIVHDITGATTPAYEELWLRFGEALGLGRDEIAGWKPFTRTYYAITTLFMYSRWWEWTWLDGIASLYAGDLLGQEQLTACYEALRDKYRMSEESLEFFCVYLRHVPTHFDWEEDALSYWCCTRERQLTAARAFRERLDIEYQMLVAVNQTFKTGKMPALSP